MSAYDLNVVNERVQERVARIDNELKILEEERERLEWISSESTSIEEVRIAKDQLETVMMKIRGLHLQINEFNRMAPLLLDAYNSPNATDREEILEEYLIRFKNFHTIQLKRKRRICSCGVDPERCETGYYCPKCCLFEQIVEYNKGGEGQGRSIVRTTENMSYFQDVIEAYQGKQALTDQRKTAIAYIESEMRAYNISKEKLTTDDVFRFLYEKKMSKNYIDVNFIWSQITGKPLRDITHLERKIMERHSMFQQIFKANVKRFSERRSSMGRFFLLWNYLWMEGIRCQIREFPAVRTETSKENLNILMRQLCDIAKERHLGMNWDAKTFP